MQPEVCGKPGHGHGHIMVVVMNKVSLHGGTEFFDDFHLLDLDTGQWSRVHPNSLSSSARVGHDCVNLDKSLVIFGGLTMLEVTSDLYLFRTDTQRTKYAITGDVPSSRLDFAITKIVIDFKQKQPR